MRKAKLYLSSCSASHLQELLWKTDVNIISQRISCKWFSPHTKKSRSFHQKRMAFNIRWKLDCTCDFVGTHASCANINRFDVAVVFNDFYFLYVGFPFSIRTSGYLGTFDTDSMTCNLAFFTNCTFSHLSHLLQTLPM